jgi:O-antigen ligase
MNGRTLADVFETPTLTSRGLAAVAAGCAALGAGVAFAGALSAFAAVLAILLALPVVWIVKSPSRALCVYAFVLPLDVYLSTTLRVTTTQVLQVAIFAGWMGQIALTTHEARRGRTSVLPYRLGGLFVLFLIVSLTWSLNVEASARTIVRTLGAILMAVYAAEHADRETLGRIARAICYGALVTAAYGFAQLVRGGYDPLYQYFSPFYSDPWIARGGGFVVVATFSNPNILAGYLLMVLPISWALWDTSTGVRRGGWILASGALAAILLLTFSKASWILLGTLALLWAVTHLPPGLSLTIGATGGVALAVVLLLIDPIIRTLLFLFPDSRQASVDSRLALWWVALSAFLERPLLGFGMDGFAGATAGLRLGYLADLIRAHNMYLQALVDLGIVGSALLWGMCFTILRRALKARVRYRDAEGSSLHLALLLAAAAYFLYGLVETLNVSNQYVNTAWLVLGLLAASTRNVAEAGRPA